MGNVYRLGGHLANLAPAATLFTPFDAHVDRDGNDKPMHTVAFDVNRLCKQRSAYSSCLWTVPLFAIAVGPHSGDWPGMMLVSVEMSVLLYGLFAETTLTV